jgi:hypothetical protein
MNCYAYSFDAIARATNALPIPDLVSEANIYEDPDFAESLQHFRQCTTEDWSIEIFSRGIDGTVTAILPAGAIPPGAVPSTDDPFHRSSATPCCATFIRASSLPTSRFNPTVNNNRELSVPSDFRWPHCNFGARFCRCRNCRVDVIDQYIGANNRRLSIAKWRPNSKHSATIEVGS